MKLYIHRIYDSTETCEKYGFDNIEDDLGENYSEYNVNKIETLKKLIKVIGHPLILSEPTQERKELGFDLDVEIYDDLRE